MDDDSTIKDNTDDDSTMKVLKDHFGKSVRHDDGIVWCQDPEVMENIVEMTEYGNDPCGCEIYQAAAFLVEVPKFTSNRGFTGGGEKSKKKRRISNHGFTGEEEEGEKIGEIKNK